MKHFVELYFEIYLKNLKHFLGYENDFKLGMKNPTT